METYEYRVRFDRLPVTGVNSISPFSICVVVSTDSNPSEALGDRITRVKRHGELLHETLSNAALPQT